MPLEDYSKWTDVNGTCELIYMWASNLNRPKSGSFVILKNKDNIVIPEFL